MKVLFALSAVLLLALARPSSSQSLGTNRTALEAAKHALTNCMIGAAKRSYRGQDSPQLEQRLVDSCPNEIEAWINELADFDDSHDVEGERRYAQSVLPTLAHLAVFQVATCRRDPTIVTCRYLANPAP
jgi:hypothetical protein